MRIIFNNPLEEKVVNVKTEPVILASCGNVTFYSIIASSGQSLVLPSVIHPFSLADLDPEIEVSSEEGAYMEEVERDLPDALVDCLEQHAISCLVFYTILNLGDEGNFKEPLNLDKYDDYFLRQFKKFFPKGKMDDKYTAALGVFRSFLLREYHHYLYFPHVKGLIYELSDELRIECFLKYRFDALILSFDYQKQFQLGYKDRSYIQEMFKIFYPKKDLSVKPDKKHMQESLYQQLDPLFDNAKRLFLVMIDNFYSIQKSFIPDLIEPQTQLDQTEKDFYSKYANNVINYLIGSLSDEKMTLQSFFPNFINLDFLINVYGKYFEKCVYNDTKKREHFKSGLKNHDDPEAEQQAHQWVKFSYIQGLKTHLERKQTVQKAVEAKGVKRVNNEQSGRLNGSVIWITHLLAMKDLSGETLNVDTFYDNETQRQAVIVALKAIAGSLKEGREDQHPDLYNNLFNPGRKLPKKVEAIRVLAHTELKNGTLSLSQALLKVAESVLSDALPQGQYSKKTRQLNQGIEKGTVDPFDVIDRMKGWN